MLRRLTFMAVLAASAALLLGGEAYAQGCAMCGTALKDGSDPLTRSLAASILFMVSMPFLLFLSVAGWLVLVNRRSRERVSKETTP